MWFHHQYNCILLVYMHIFPYYIGSVQWIKREITLSNWKKKYYRHTRYDVHCTVVCMILDNDLIQLFLFVGWWGAWGWKVSRHATILGWCTQTFPQRYLMIILFCPTFDHLFVIFLFCDLIGPLFTDFQMRCPHGKKTKVYKRAKLEKFAHYLMKDGLISRLSVYEDRECKIQTFLVFEGYTV